MNNPMIILGGMGPQASIELHRLIVEKASLIASSPDEYPNILHASIAVPDFISDEQATAQAVKDISATCDILPIDAASAIGMACNTAHLLLNGLTQLHGENFISMIDAVCDDVEILGTKRVGVLASPFTIKTKLYETPLLERGVSVVSPVEHEIDELGNIIRDLIAGSAIKPLRIRLSRLANQLSSRGAECIILGCTELPLIGVDSTVVSVSSLESLATRMMQSFYRENAILEAI